jgi:hypothetical protein
MRHARLLGNQNRTRANSTNNNDNYQQQSREQQQRQHQQQLQDKQLKQQEQLPKRNVSEKERETEAEAKKKTGDLEERVKALNVRLTQVEERRVAEKGELFARINQAESGVAQVVGELHTVNEILMGRLDLVAVACEKLQKGYTRLDTVMVEHDREIADQKEESRRILHNLKWRIDSVLEIALLDTTAEKREVLREQELKEAQEEAQEKALYNAKVKALAKAWRGRRRTRPRRRRQE